MSNLSFSKTVSIDLAIYESQLRGEIASDLTTLQVASEAICNPEYKTMKYVLKQGLTISEISVPPAEFLKRREINKCFKSIVGSLQDYMDKLISILRLKSEKINLTEPMSQREINIFLSEKFERHLMDVSTDISLNVPKKLDILLDKPEQQVHKDSIQSYFNLRNGLEHHKGIAKTDRVVHYKRLGLASTAGYEVEGPGMLGAGEGLVLKTFDEKIAYDKGGSMLLTKEQLDSIVLNLLIFIVPTVQNATGEKFNV